MRQNQEISILLATYNAEKYIRQLLESIFCQSYKNWVIVVSDDGSSDSTPAIIKDYKTNFPDKIEITEAHEPFRNARDNFFYLMKHAKGVYAMFCDHDDVWNENKIETTLERMHAMEDKEGRDKPLLVHTDLEVVDSDMKRKAPSFVRFSKLDGNRTALHQLAVQNVVTGCTTMINEPLLKLAQKCENQLYVLMHDWWVALVAAAFGRISFVDKATIKYRQHSDNSIGAKRYIASPIYMVRKIFHNEIRKSIEDTTRQAAVFLDTYRDLLSQNDKELMEGFSKLYTRGKYGRIGFMIKNRVFKYGALRKFAQIIWG